MKIYFPVAIAPSIVSAPAWAQKTLSFNAPFTQVGSIAVYNAGTCQAGTKNVKIKKAPENGLIELREWNRTVRSKDKCNGADVPATNVFYKPKTGFRGKDTFVVTYERFGRHGSMWEEKKFFISVP